jgi:hypothetical protein
MFAKLALFQNFDRRLVQPLAAAGRPCNDNNPARRLIAPPRRKAKPRLLSRWHITLAGALECTWQAESADQAAAEPISRRRSGPVAALRRAARRPAV